MSDHADLSVRPGALEALAAQHDRVADNAAQTAAVTTHLHTQVWQSYGPLFAVVNCAFTYAEEQRRSAVRRIHRHCTDHAATLRVAAAAYDAGDAVSGRNLDRQLRDC